MLDFFSFRLVCCSFQGPAMSLDFFREPAALHIVSLMLSRSGPLETRLMTLEQACTHCLERRNLHVRT